MMLVFKWREAIKYAQQQQQQLQKKESNAHSGDIRAQSSKEIPQVDLKVK